MKKKLKIQFVKFEKALAMQVLEQAGLPEEKKSGKIKICSCAALNRCEIFLRGNIKSWDFIVTGRLFDSNEERDNYFNKAIQAITDELFGGCESELKIGKRYLFSDDCEAWENLIYASKVPLVIDTDYQYVAVHPHGGAVRGYKYIRPINQITQPTIEGDIYTWESEE